MNVVTGRKIGSMDWGGLIENVVNTAGSVVQSSNQVKQQQIAANAATTLAQYNLAQQQASNQYTQSGSLIPGVPNVVLIGGAAVLAFMLLRRRGR
jgi:hypothetical protein